MSRLQRPNREGGHSVEAWGKKLGKEKVEHHEWDQFSDAMLTRCTEDTEIQFLIYQELLREGFGEGWDAAHRLNSKLYRYLQRQEEYGWRVDADYMGKCIRQLERWMRKIDNAITPRLPVILEQGTVLNKPFRRDGSYSALAEGWGSITGNTQEIVGPFTRVGFRRVDLDKNEEVKDYLLSLGWEPDEWNYDKLTGEKRSPKLSKNDNFDGIKDKLGRVVCKRLQCKQRKGTIQGLYNSIRPDGRISPKVGAMAKTGRLTHKGVVNIPGAGEFYGKQMRKMFIASPGMIMVGVDSKGNQQRQLISRINLPLDHPFAIGVIHGNSKDGTDEHSVVQKRIGLPSRKLAKNVYYGRLFGAGISKIARICGSSRKQAEEYCTALDASVPGVRETIVRLTEEWRSTAKKVFNQRWQRWEYYDGWVRGLDGRQIQIEKEHTILVYLLQSDEAIQMAAAYVWFQHQMEKRGYEFGKDWGILIWMHDEYQFECSPRIIDEATELAKRSISWAGEYFKIQCPHEGEAKTGVNWLETH